MNLAIFYYLIESIFNLMSDNDLKKTLILGSANVGSFGAEDDITAANSCVRQQTIDTLCAIENDFNWVDIFCVQECSSYKTELRPIFYEPTCTDENVLFGRGSGGIRGVCTYSKAGEKFEFLNSIHECCVTVHAYKNSKRNAVKVAICNIYRNQSKRYERTISQTKTFINSLTKLIMERGIRNIMVIGDFNAEQFEIDGFRELKHEEAYHKANKNTRKKYIDKCFTNFTTCGFIKIFPSVENVHGEDCLTKTNLGHKFMCLYIGEKPTKAMTKKVSTVDLRKVKDIAKDNIYRVKSLEDFRLASNTNENEVTEALAEDLSSVIDQIISKSTKEVKILKRRINHILVSELEKNLCGRIRSDKAWKPFFSYCTIVKNKIELVKNEKKGPSIKEKVDTLNEKLSKLNNYDEAVMDELIEKIYPIDYEKRGEWILNMNKFTTLITSTSNSGAKDDLNMSLKITKQIFRFNRDIVKRFHLIADRCLTLGYFPNIWKADKIIFIFKNKGDYNCPKNWRPITIAVSLGKTLEKVASHFLSTFEDYNSENHAYTRNRSTLTAIASAQMQLTKAIQVTQCSNQNDTSDQNGQYSNQGNQFSNLGNQFSNQGNQFSNQSNQLSNQRILFSNTNSILEEEDESNWETICLISLDDISSAFESVPHILIYKILYRTYAGEKFKIAEFIASYLNRSAYGYDSETGEKANIVKTYQNRSVPQGSLLSPMLWRIFDKVFSEYYKILLECFIRNRHINKTAIRNFGHTVFADDQKSPLVLRVKRTDSMRNKAIKIRQAFLSCRELIQIATKTLGCGVNPSKSENIVPQKYIPALNDLDIEYMTAMNLDPEIDENKFKVKDTYKWLGFVLKLTEAGNIIFDQISIKNRLILVGKFRDNVYQYTFKTLIRIKIYQTYLTPFIELYLPLVIQHPADAITLIHKFQHTCLTKAIKVSFTASRNEVEEVLGIRPVLKKAIRMCVRIQTCCNTKSFGADINEAEEDLSKTRSGKILNKNATNASDRQNIIFRINLYAKMEEKINKHFEKPAREINKIDKWAAKTNEKIKRKIQDKIFENDSKRRKIE